MSPTKTKTVKTSTAPDYEKSLARLEQIVQQLETGELSLEQSLNLFEEGIGLARYCAGKLDAAEGHLEQLLGVSGTTPQTIPFQPNQVEE